MTSCTQTCKQSSKQEDGLFDNCQIHMYTVQTKQKTDTIMNKYRRKQMNMRHKRHIYFLQTYMTYNIHDIQSSGQITDKDGQVK